MTLIAGGITAAATGIFAGISQISDGFEKMGSSIESSHP